MCGRLCVYVCVCVGVCVCVFAWVIFLLYLLYPKCIICRHKERGTTHD